MLAARTCSPTLRETFVARRRLWVGVMPLLAEEAAVAGEPGVGRLWEATSTLIERSHLLLLLLLLKLKSTLQILHENVLPHSLAR